MKKKTAAFLIGVCSMALLAGCSGKAISNDKIEISQYKGLEVEKLEPVEVLDEHVDSSIQSTLEAKSTEKEITDRPVKNGDIATINYVGKKDGVEFEGGTAENYPLTIGSGQFIDGFEDGIIGHSVGETFDLELTFPEEYPSKDLAGQKVVFTVTINKISQKIVPELTDELVKEISDKSKNVKEYKKEVKADLEKSNAESSKSRLEQNVWGALVEKCKVKKYPEDKKKEVMDSFTSQYSSVAEMYGMDDVEEFAKQMFGVSIEEMAEKTIAQEYAVELIADKEKMKISDEDYKKGLKEYAERFGYDDSKQLEDAVGKEQLKKAMMQEKVTKFLVDNCKQVAKKAEKKEK